MFGIGKPKDKKYFSGGGMGFGKRDKYTSLFSEPEEELYFESDPMKTFHAFGFESGGTLKRPTKARGFGGFIGDLADPHTYGLQDGGHVRYPYPRYKLPVEEVTIQDHVATEAFGIGGNISDIATYLFGDATTKVKNFLKEHGDEQIQSIELGRVPIQSAISTVMNLISSGEYNKQIEKKGYDAFFHLFIVINDKYVLEKNQNVNVKTNYKRQDDEDRISLGTSKNTINEFVNNAVEKMGKDDFWRNYEGLRNNCQWWVENTVAANGLSREKANDFAFQDTKELREAINPTVQEALKETTSIASGIDKFLSWISGGAWGLAKGGMVRKRIGSMK
jgi:hypothetical protein